jgi:hypothetical protein
VTGEGIYEVKFLLYDQNKQPIGEYTTDDQIALLANGEDSNEHAEELAIFHENRRMAKKAVDELLARNI